MASRISSVRVYCWSASRSTPSGLRNSAIGLMTAVGVYLIREGSNDFATEVGAPDWTYGDEVMVEPYVAGQELCVDVGQAPHQKTLRISLTARSEYGG